MRSAVNGCATSATCRHLFCPPTRTATRCGLSSVGVRWLRPTRQSATPTAPHPAMVASIFPCERDPNALIYNKCVLLCTQQTELCTANCSASYLHHNHLTRGGGWWWYNESRNSFSTNIHTIASSFPHTFISAIISYLIMRAQQFLDSFTIYSKDASKHTSETLRISKNDGGSERFETFIKRRCSFSSIHTSCIT